MARERVGSAVETRGFKYLLDVFPLLRSLRDSGCTRDRAGNRELFYDQYVALMLVALFSPAIDSMRCICRASGLKKVQRKLGVRQVSLGSFSESSHVFDPELLRGVIEPLLLKLHPVGRDPRLAQMKHLLTIVDATLLKALPKMAQAMWDDTEGAPRFAWKLHTQFVLEKYVPERIDITGAGNGGNNDEAAVLRQTLQPGRCYVLDRYFAQFALFNDLHAVDSSYVCRVRDNSRFAVSEERELSTEALAAGIVRDAIVTLGLGSKSAHRPNHPVRLIEVECTPHEKRSGTKGGRTSGPPAKQTLLIATDLLDVPADVIALIYRYRWTIEIFFRFFKQLLGCRHLYSQHPNGIAIQVYCAIIACLLLNLWTGAKPRKATLEMFAWYFSGWADEEELQAHLMKLQENPA